MKNRQKWQGMAIILGGSFTRIQFPPALVPADLVGTRIWQTGSVTTGPVPSLTRTS